MCLHDDETYYTKDFNPTDCHHLCCMSDCQSQTGCADPSQVWPFREMKIKPLRQKGQLKWRDALQLGAQRSRPRRHVPAVVNVISKGFGDSRSGRSSCWMYAGDGGRRTHRWIRDRNNEIDKQMGRAHLADVAALLDACKKH